MKARRKGWNENLDRMDSGRLLKIAKDTNPPGKGPSGLPTNDGHKAGRHPQRNLHRDNYERSYQQNE